MTCPEGLEGVLFLRREDWNAFLRSAYTRTVKAIYLCAHSNAIYLYAHSQTIYLPIYILYMNMYLSINQSMRAQPSSFFLTLLHHSGIKHHLEILDIVQFKRMENSLKSILLLESLVQTHIMFLYRHLWKCKNNPSTKLIDSNTKLKF